MPYTSGGFFFGAYDCFCCKCCCTNRMVYSWTQRPAEQNPPPVVFPSGVLCSSNYCGCYKAEVIVNDGGYGYYLVDTFFIGKKKEDETCCIEGLKDGYRTDYLTYKGYSNAMQLWVMCKCTSDQKYIEHAKVDPLRNRDGSIVNKKEECK